MNCESARRLIDAYMDSELDSPAAFDVESHLASCPGCRKMLESRQELSRAIKYAAVYAPAPDHLRVQVRKKTSPNHRLRFGLATAGLAFAIAAAVMGVWRPWASRTPIQDKILADVLAHHRESVMCSRFTDIGSADPKAVQAWFSKKLNYTPRIPDTSHVGFALMGGRVDIIAGQTTPVLAYLNGGHHTDVFVTPSGENESFDTAKDGLQVLSWKDCGLGYWIVSDDTPDKLDHLQGSFMGRRRDR